MSSRKEIPGLYKVVKFFRVSGRREILRRNLSREEAQRSLVGFTKQGGPEA